MTYPFFGSEGRDEFLAPFTPEDVCVGGAQAVNDASIAASLQQDEFEAHGRAGAPNASGQSSLRRTRTDDEMKELLKTLQVPHFVRELRTHGQHNCLMDSKHLAGIARQAAHQAAGSS